LTKPSFTVAKIPQGFGGSAPKARVA